MSDNDWVRVINNKNIYTSGQVRGGSVRADGRLSTGEVLQLEGVNTAGAVCSPNGLVSRDATGAILSCQSGAWKAPDKGQYIDIGGFSTTSTRGVTYSIPGTHKFCMISGFQSAGDNGTCRVYSSQSGSVNWKLDMVGYNGSSTQTCYISCLD